MALIDPSRILNNLIVLAALLGIGFLVYSKMDKEKVKSTIDGFKKLFGGSREEK